mgnify:CR=1 FL=1
MIPYRIPPVNILEIKRILLQKRTAWIVSIFLLFLLLVQFQCSSNHDNKIAEREKEIKINKKIQDSLYQVNKEKDIVIAKSEKIIEDNDKKIVKLELDKKAEKLKGEKQIAKVKDYNLRQWQSYYQELANCTDEQINIYGNTLAFNKEPLVTIAGVIIKGQVAVAQGNITLEQLAKSQDNEKQLKFVVQQERDKNANTESMLTAEKDTSKKWEDNFNDSQKDLKKAKRPKFVPILLGIAAGFGAGVVLTN